METNTQRWKLLLYNQNFQKLFLGQLISALGDWAAYIAVPILIMRLTNTVSAVAIYMIARFIPMIVGGPILGILVDRWNRKALLIIADISRAGLFFLMLEVRNEYVIYGLTAIIAILNLLFTVGRQAVVPNIVSKDDLVTANGLQNGASSVMMFIGPAIAGALLAVIDLRLLLAFNAISFIISAIFIGACSIPRSSEAKEQAHSYYHDVVESWSYLRKNPALMRLLWTGIFSQAGYGAFIVLLPIFGTQSYQVGEKGYGFIMSALGGGLLIGSILSSFQKLMNVSATMYLCLGLSGLFYIVFCNVSLIAIAIPIIFIIGLSDAFQQVSYATIQQIIVSDGIRGRIYTINEIVSSVSVTIGMSGIGILADHMAARSVGIFASFLILIGALVGGILVYPLLNAQVKGRALELSVD